MVQPTQEQLLQALEAVESELKRFQDLVKELVPEKEWYSSQEFAAKTGLKVKTVSNYCGKGRLERVKQDSAGKWLIHQSELKKWK